MITMIDSDIFFCLSQRWKVFQSKKPNKKMDAVSGLAYSDSHYLPVADSVNYMLALISSVFLHYSNVIHVLYSVQPVIFLLAVK